MNDRLEDLSRVSLIFDLQYAERCGEIKPIEDEKDFKSDLDIMEYVAQVQLIQNYTNQMIGRY